MMCVYGYPVSAPISVHYWWTSFWFWNIERKTLNGQKPYHCKWVLDSTDFYSGLNLNRRLLDTEKLVLKTHRLDFPSNQDGMYVLVNVEPEGIVAIPHRQERECIVFNTVCDELLLGIPHQAWWVVVLVLLCLILSFIIPRFLPSFLLPNNQSSRTVDHNVTKNS